MGKLRIDILKFYKEDEDCANIVFSFKGNLNSQLLRSITEIADIKLSNIEKRGDVRKRVFSVFIECVQNLFHHTYVTNENSSLNNDSSFVMLTKGEDCYKVCTGNLIENSSANTLKKRLDSIKGKSKEELKQLYQERLKEANFNKKGGGGLGMMDILRKPNQKVNYDFIEVDKQRTLFSFAVKLNTLQHEKD